MVTTQVCNTSRIAGMSNKKRLLIVGNMGGTNIGGSILRAAHRLGLDAHLIETHSAMDAPKWIRRFNWWVRGRRPTWLGRFGKQVVSHARELQPTWLITTGSAPLNQESLEEFGQIGVVRMNFLTDDPWNPAHRAGWLFKSLPNYDYVFSPRRSNIGDLKELGCPSVSYLPFAYDENLFYPQKSVTSAEKHQFQSDISFAGGADKERVPYFAALSKAGFNVALYGDYWDRFPETRKLSRGYADPHILRAAISETKVALCLVRRANRDGHSMRTFEVPAVGACMLVEDTEEHREIFGEEGKAVVYFGNPGEMIEKTRWLLQQDEERQRLAQAAHSLIVSHNNTYSDRLAHMLSTPNLSDPNRMGLPH
jgi:hypothetical protein